MRTFLLQPQDDNGPVFNEPWEAQAFAIVLALHGAGKFSWSEWADYLSEEIKIAQHSGDPDLGNTYYQHWLSALEKITVAKNLSTNNDILNKTEQWRQAYLASPHGQPIELT